MFMIQSMDQEKIITNNAVSSVLYSMTKIHSINGVHDPIESTIDKQLSEASKRVNSK